MSKRRIVEDCGTSSRIVFGGRARRPVDKKIITINKATVGGSGFSTDLFTATFPCTIQGLRVDLNIFQDAGTTSGVYAWVIIILRQGIVASTVNTGDAATLYQPEQDVLMFGSGGGNQNGGPFNNAYRQMTTKTMRKFMGGDKLVFIGIGENTNTSQFTGAVQYFCKT